MREFDISRKTGYKIFQRYKDCGLDGLTDRSRRPFLGVIKHYCKANDIDISREVNIGRGPVDFKVAQGYQFRCLLELKLARNTRFWNGLSRQLPTYQEAEDVRIGYFIVVVQSEEDLGRLTEIDKKVAQVKAATGYKISAFIIDARRNPPSASKL